ncbi:hypothetical protein POPTR_014G139000v4 [Populus trichocarpa]|uniref:Uncharacterized protein n=1 Tax=Populus trichocarpa TaxID=3694 RepID=A0ACC0RZD3_POPTR|nr:uncharacterized protein LOC7466279 isoform X1 [Populus trichocarpa]KAI9382474.1 hypothetical protein POPTR_014G139000v4 [Populus trichocarpa]
MGFSTVYKCLTDVFPQVDARILKAVAIEHSKDADIAAEVVLSEVIPSLSRHSAAPSPPCEDTSPSLPLDGQTEQEEETGLRHRQVSLVKSVRSSEPGLIAEEDDGKTELTSGVNDGDSTHQENRQDQPIVVPSGANADTNQLQGHIETEQEEETGLRHRQVSLVKSVRSSEPGLIAEEDDGKTELTGGVNDGDSTHQEIRQDQPVVVPSGANADTNQLQGHIESDELILLGKPQHQEGISQPGSSQTLILVSNDLLLGVNAENMNSKQYRQIELLEEIVEAAKDNKKTLFSAMESVMNMMKEVELQEISAEQAKEEAARGGLDILVEVEKLKQMLVHAKEANDMHAGEVYGEKAILATEVRELQARLLSLSDERDNALAILDEMRQTLESRLAAAEELRKTAELEKLEKEETARNALAEQEIIMEKVVQESKILQKEAEENAKLQEFLMDRGCVVDTLQGEISVICQDVRLLKERFDERVPLSKSVSSSQTSCILASSGSSIKSMASNLAAETGETSELPKEPILACSVERDFSNEKQLLDDGWDFVEE